MSLCSSTLLQLSSPPSLRHSSSMNIFSKFFVIFLVAKMSTTAFVVFEPNKEYKFKVDYERVSVVPDQQNLEIPLTTTIQLEAVMTVKLLQDNWFSFKLSESSFKNTSDESEVSLHGLDKEFRAKIERKKETQFVDTTKSSPAAWMIKQMVITELFRDHSELLRLPYTEVTGSERVKMPIGACEITKLNLKTTEKDNLRTKSYKCDLKDCILVDDVQRQLTGLTKTGFNEVFLTFDTRTNAHIGVRNVLKVSVSNGDVVTKGDQNVAIKLIDTENEF